MRILKFETSPIIGHHIFLGHYLSYYRRQFVKYLYNQGQGEIIMGQIEGLLATGGTVGMLVLVIERWSGWLMPWQMAITLGIIIKIGKVYLGHLDKTKLKIGQAMSNYGIESGVTPKSAEMFDKVTDIHKVVCPDKVNKKYETYFEK